MIELRVQPGAAAAASLTQIKLIATRFPGVEPLRILVGERKIDLGPEWRYDGSSACIAALSEFGEVRTRGG